MNLSLKNEMRTSTNRAYNDRIEFLKKNVKPISGISSVRKGVYYLLETDNSSKQPFDTYGVDVINDCLRSIRNKKTGYLFSERQLVEVLKFEPHIDVKYDDGVYYIN